jgi:hypothetical protein
MSALLFCSCFSGAPKKIRIDEEDQEYIGEWRGGRRREESREAKNEDALSDTSNY